VKTNLIEDIIRALDNPAPEGDGGESVQSLLDLLDRALPLLQPEWQPMETVPMDGRDVLVKVGPVRNKPEGVHVAQYRQNITLIGQMFYFDMPPALGWMPMPGTCDDA
jgi:hypothetical protein